jgi:hypothetical protein
VGLLRESCAEQGKATTFFDYEVAWFEPARYTIVSGIPGHRWEWESLGAFQQKEYYSIAGYSTIFSGDNPATNTRLALEVLQETYALFQATVMTPLLSNRNAPVLGNTHPQPGAVYLMLPGETAYVAGVGDIGGEPAGWQSRLDWTFEFSALVNPE